jgi:putative transposase
VFAALDIATGKVIADCKRRHRHQEFLAFLNELEANVPGHLDVHLILDNYGTHKHQKVKAWLARRPRSHLHFTPTYASWLNQVERWFALITQRAIRRGSFRKVRELIDRIERFITSYNKTARIRASARALRSLLERRLDDREWLVLVLDGKTFAEDSIVIALGDPHG